MCVQLTTENLKKSVALTTEKLVKSDSSQNENNFAVGAFCLRQIPGDGEFSSHNIDYQTFSDRIFI